MTPRSSTLRAPHRWRTGLLGIAVLVALAACGGGATPAPRVTATVTNGVVNITAKNIAFDVETIEAPAGEPFTVHMINAESQPHDIAVYNREGGDLIAASDIITGPDQSIDLAVPAQQAGEYFFVCRVHSTEPAMKGRLVVGP